MVAAWRHALLLSVLTAGCAALAGLDDEYEVGAPSTPSGAAGGTGGTGLTGGTGGMGLTGGTGGGGLTGGTGGGGGADCGNGLVEPPEECDDQNDKSDDGCSSCEIDDGFTCKGQPSQCEPIPPQVVSTAPNLGLGMKDGLGLYDGTLATMDCVTLDVADQGYTSVQRVEVTIAVDHTWLGDLIVKVVSPGGTTTTVLSRAGVAELADTYYEPDGDSSDLVASHPIRFRDGAPHDAESMGSSIGGSLAACRDDGGWCEYHPNPGAGPGTNLADFNGQDPVGVWQVCLGDGDSDDVGTIQQISLSVLAW